MGKTVNNPIKAKVLDFTYLTLNYGCWAQSLDPPPPQTTNRPNLMQNNLFNYVLTRILLTTNDTDGEIGETRGCTGAGHLLEVK